MPNTIPPPPAPWRIPLALYLHPFEVLVGFALVLIGLRNLGVGDGLSAPPSILAAVGREAGVAWLAGSLLGGLGILVGVLGHSVALLRAVEKAGLYLVAGTSTAYAVALLGNVGVQAAGYSAATYAAIGGACLIRARAIRRAELATLEALRAVNDTTSPLEPLHPVELVQPRRRASDVAGP